MRDGRSVRPGFRTERVADDGDRVSHDRKQPLVIDCHGHYTTAPPALEAWRKRQVASLSSHEDAPRASDLHITDDDLRESVEGAQLRLQRERGTDLTIFSPRASFMAHHVGTAETSAAWAALCNETLHRVVDLHPDNFVGACMLPQSPGVPPEHCIAELDRCIEEYGFVSCNLNPDPSGGWWRDPPLTDRWWYPLYERLVALDVPAMVHVSTSCNACFHTTGAHYLNADTTAFMQFVDSQLFRDFPTLRFVIPHGGGAVPYHWGRFRGLAQDLKLPPLRDHVLGNVFFDTCVYHQPGIDLLLDVIPDDNILFGAEVVGAVRGIDVETGFPFDDTKRYIDAHTGLSDASRRKIFEGNARRVFPRLDRILQGREVVA